MESGIFIETEWSTTLGLTSVAMSMIVNALVTGLIVFKISKVFREAKGITTSGNKSLVITGGTKLRSVIFVILESGMALFAVQLIRFVFVIPEISTTDASAEAYFFIVAFHEMLTVIILSIIVTLYLLLIS